ncbi:hypothetical protein C8R44DRAFT_623658, partial [Mycena epipterygia]
MGKGFLLTAQRASRRIFTYVFPRELELLEALLTNVERLQLVGSTFGYRVEKDRFQQLLQILYRLRVLAEDSFRIAGKTPPALPSWGDDEDILDVYDQNSFEISGVCFRVEVENFLWLLDKYYNFAERKPQDRDPEASNAADDWVKSTGNMSITHRSEQDPQSFSQYDRGYVGKASGSIIDPLTNSSTIRMTPQGHFGHRDIPPHMHRGNAGERRSGTRSPNGFRRGHAPPAGDPDDGDDGDDDDDRGNPGRRSAPFRLPGDRVNPGGRVRSAYSGTGLSTPKVPHFDLKLKYENVPKWDGNVDTIIRWMLKINDIARESEIVFQQLGRVVPKRLEGEAEVWYWSLPIKYRSEIEQDWDTLRKAFSTYFLNRKWLDRQRGRANRATYRDSGHSRETPSEYFIRKTELLNTVYTMDDSEIILEVMDGAPSTWNTILTTQMYRDIVEFQSAIRYHEDALMKLDRHDRESNYRERERDRDRDYQRNNIRTARVNLVGWSANLGPPKFPKDDRNVSKKATPESKGARPCRHCGSGKHWDNECKHSFKGNRAARTNLATSTSDDLNAQEEYDDLYYGLDIDDSELSDGSNQGFEEPLQ